MDQPPPGRQVDQSALMDDSLRTPELIGKRHSDKAVEFEAMADTRFVPGHPACV